MREGGGAPFADGGARFEAGIPAEAAPIPDPGDGASCVGLANHCGLDENESCCTSLLVPGGSFYRSSDASRPATVSDFRLDKYEATAERFNNFGRAWDAGWRPSAGAGKHTHLNAGSGVSNSAEPGFEGGWDATWDQNVSVTGTLGIDTYPVHGINWFEAYAFCIWDGGFLPTEAEWNYAAAGGAEQRYYPWSVPPSSMIIDGTYRFTVI